MYDISRHLTRMDCDHFLERLLPFLDDVSSKITFREINPKNRDLYLDTHEEITMQFGAESSRFLDALANGIVSGSTNSHCLEALKQYEALPAGNSEVTA